MSLKSRVSVFVSVVRVCVSLEGSTRAVVFVVRMMTKIPIFLI